MIQLDSHDKHLWAKIAKAAHAGKAVQVQLHESDRVKLPKRRKPKS